MDDAGGQRPYGRVDALDGNADAVAHGQRIKIKGFPNDHQVRLFRGEGSPHRPAWSVTHAPTQDSTAATPEVGGLRWQSEQGPRQGKQGTGLERGQCRKTRLQWNHSGFAFLVGVRSKP